MDAFYNNIGKRTRDYGEHAEAIFKLLLQRWMGHPVDLSSITPDNKGVDIVSRMSSLTNGKIGMVPDHIQFEWQVKHTTRVPRRTTLLIKGQSIDVINTGITKKTVKSLRTYASETKAPYLLAFGVVRDESSYGNLIDRDAYDAFDWYGLDLKQYFSVVSEDYDVIRIPVANKLNAVSFALLWASHWTREFYSPVVKLPSFYNRELLDFAGRIYSPKVTMRSASHDDIEAIFRGLEKVPSMLERFDGSTLEKTRIATVLGLGATLQDINSKIEREGPIEQLSTYCPEALYGTTSLWLFSRSYRSFMSVSAAAVDSSMSQMNQRWLPVRSDLKETPRLLWVLLSCVVRLYAHLGVNVAVVRPHCTEDLGFDRSVYGGRIGHPPYITLSETGFQWTRDISSQGELSAHKDFFAEQYHDKILTSLGSSLEIPSLTDLPETQLQFPEFPPLFLFAQEDNFFIRHPRELWTQLQTSILLK